MGPELELLDGLRNELLDGLRNELLDGLRNELLDGSMGSKMRCSKTICTEMKINSIWQFCIIIHLHPKLLISSGL